VTDSLLWLDKGGDGVAFVGFDSNPLFEAFATGKVSEEQISDFTTEMKKPDRLERWRDVLRIAVVHHHPVPIPYTSTTTFARVAESMMIFYNAGTFLRQLGGAGVDLILHGHKHFSGFVRMSFDVPERGRHEIGVLAAGSATRGHPDDPLGNEFGIIDLYDDETVEIERWYHAAGIDKADTSTRFPLYTLREVRIRRERRAILEQGYSIGRIVRRVRLTKEGYSEIIETLERCVVTRKAGLDRVHLRLDTERPQYVRQLTLVPSAKSPSFSQLRIEEGVDPRHVKATILLGANLAPESGPFELSYRYLLINGHAMSADELQRKLSRSKETWEYAGAECSGATGALRLQVEFPGDVALLVEKYDGEALYEPNSLKIADTEAVKQHDDESRRVMAVFKPDTNLLEIEVAEPVPGFIYRVRWSYQQIRKASSQGHRQPEAAVKQVVHQLISLASGRNSPQHQEVCKTLHQLRSEVEKRFLPTASGEVLDVSLFVMDDREGVLRLVAKSEPEHPEAYAATLYPGEGCAGFSFEKQRVLFYDAERDALGYYLRPEELRDAKGAGPDALMPQNLLITIPCVYEGVPVGVVSIGSQSGYSRLLPIFEKDGPGQEQEAAFLYGLTRLLGQLLVKLLRGG